MSTMQNDHLTRKARAAALQQPRPFRAHARHGEVLAMDPQAFDFSFMFAGCEPNDRTESNIAIVKISGPLEHHTTWCWDSYESIVQRVESAMTGEDMQLLTRYCGPSEDGEAPSEGTPPIAVVLCIDSPGGDAAGSAWAHRKLRALRKQYGIPLYAYANEMAASAAYAIACAADEIWLPDTGTVGSIGVIATLFDRTKMNAKQGLNVELVTSGAYKADNHADRVIDDGVRERIQGRVMVLANVFWKFVAKSRGTTPDAVSSLEAGVFIGQDAVDVGIADGVAGWDKFLNLVAEANQPEDETLTGDESSAA